LGVDVYSGLRAVREMMMQRLLFVTGVLAMLFTYGCKYEAPTPFTADLCFPSAEGSCADGSGVEVSAETLSYGQEQYILYCYACHGDAGDGRGPASRWLRPPPRDFRIASFKFGKVTDGLPHDSDLKKIIDHGLVGTPMLDWNMAAPTLDAIVQYIKTFSKAPVDGQCAADEESVSDDSDLCASDDDCEEDGETCFGAEEGEGFMAVDAVLGEQIAIGEDPWAAKPNEAVSRGEELYHGYQCWSCHPSYVSRAKISEATKKIKGTDVKSYRPNLFVSEPKTSGVYSVGYVGAPACGDGAENPRCPDGQSCLMGRCETKLKIVLLDFTMDSMRAAHFSQENTSERSSIRTDVRGGVTVEDLYATISAGIPGSGMPQWKGSVKDEDIWAVAHYVKSLTNYKGTPNSISLKEKLRAGDKK
jgi:mono/diheme cytochrome c family protein